MMSRICAAGVIILALLIAPANPEDKTWEEFILYTFTEFSPLETESTGEDTDSVQIDFSTRPGDHEFSLRRKLGFSHILVYEIWVNPFSNVSAKAEGEGSVCLRVILGELHGEYFVHGRRTEGHIRDIPGRRMYGRKNNAKLVFSNPGESLRFRLPFEDDYHEVDIEIKGLHEARVSTMDIINREVPGMARTELLKFSMVLGDSIKVPHADSYAEIGGTAEFSLFLTVVPIYWSREDEANLPSEYESLDEAVLAYDLPEELWSELLSEKTVLQQH